APTPTTSGSSPASCGAGGRPGPARADVAARPVPAAPLRVVADIPLRIDPDEVLRFQGYKRGRDVPGPDVQALLDEALALGRTLMTPRAVIRWAAVTRQAGPRLEAEDLALTIPDLERHWGPIERGGAVVCTIGDALERRVA